MILDDRPSSGSFLDTFWASMSRLTSLRRLGYFDIFTQIKKNSFKGNAIFKVGILNDITVKNTVFNYLQNK